MKTDGVFDVAVIGAGLAGLHAADQLREAGRDVIVVEAADRIGGRLIRQSAGGAVVDGGGSWIGPTQHRVSALIKKLGLTTVATYTRGRTLFLMGNRVRSSRSSIPPLPVLALVEAAAAVLRLDAIARALPRRAAELDGVCLGHWLRRHVRSHGARTLIDIAVGATTGSSVEEVSLLAFATHIRAAGGLHQLIGVRGAAQDARVAGGSVSICERLAARLGDQRIRLGSPVTAVEQRGESVELQIRGAAAVTARRVVVAVDPATCSRIDFGPALHRGRRALHRGLTMGSGIKFHVAYEAPFWRRAGLNGQSYADVGLARLTFDATPDATGPGVLVGFLGDVLGAEIDDAAELLDPPAVTARRRRVIGDLQRLFGPQAATPLAYVEHDWRGEAFLTGCVPAARPGVLTAAGRGVHAPWGRVHWAGAETSDVWEGHMDGAVCSAERVVAEIMSLR